MADITVKLLPKQVRFVTDTAPCVLYSGAYRAGKSYTLGWKALVRANVPGAREALVRKRLVDLKATTLRTLLEGDGSTPPVLPPGTYDHHKTENIIRIHGGGEIVYFGLDDMVRIGSRTLSGVAVDEAQELNEDEWMALNGRPSLKHPLGGQVYAACNPGAPTHFLAKRFGLGPPYRPMSGYSAIQTKTADNPHLPGHYLARVAQFTGIMHKRYVLGQWVANEGAVYERFDSDTHCVTRDGPWVRTILCVDVGTAVATSMLRIREDKEGRAHLDRMVHRVGMVEQEMVDALDELAEGERPTVVIDPGGGGAQLRTRLRRDGWTVVNADKESVNEGINECRARIEPHPAGGFGFTVDPSCSEFRDEIGAYEFKRDTDGHITDTPEKGNDHAMDAWRYGMMFLRRPSSALIGPSVLARLKSSREKSLPSFDLTIGSKIGWDLELEKAIRAKVWQRTVKVTDGGPWKVWPTLLDERPDQGRRYIVSASVGSGLAGSPTCVKVGDVEMRSCVAEAVLDGLPPDRAARLVMLACLWWGGLGNPLLIWRWAGPGVAFGETVRRCGYGPLYRTRKPDGTLTDDIGWQWTMDDQQALFGQWRGDVEAGRYDDPSEDTAKALSRWIMHPNGEVGPATLTADGDKTGTASDLGLAAMLLNHAFAHAAKLPIPKPVAPAWSLEWVKEQGEKQKRRNL